MTPAQLKESLLQYAIKGKLVEQKPEEGTAEDLLHEIAKEKEKLISDGKIPKEKKLADISEDEKEFDIPDSWRYVRVQDIASYITDYVANGSFATLKKHTTTYKTPNYAIFVRTMDLTAGFNGECSYIDKASYDFLEKSKLYGGELILPNIGGSIGKAFLLPNLGMPMSLAPNSIMLKFLHPVMNKFFSYIIQSTYGKKFLIDTKGGTATPKFSKTELRNMVVMLPPIREIERIVAKIEDLLPYVDRYAKAYEKLEKLNAKFPEDMKKSILQYAIQGKLVEQRPEEGTAEELYQQIQDEKQKLIKDKKIKKEKPPAEIGEDEIPFDIPESWKWVRVCSVGVTQTGNTPKKSHPEYFGNYVPFLGPGDIQNGNVNYDNQGLSEEGKEYGRVTPSDSVLQVCIGGSIGKCALVDREVTFNQQINSIYPLISDSKYVYYVLDSYYFKDYMKENSGGTATPIINRGLWDAIVIPLPPLEEQHRIVAKIEELLPFCERLVK